jgi:hypothetical protein
MCRPATPGVELQTLFVERPLVALPLGLTTSR